MMTLSEMRYLLTGLLAILCVFSALLFFGRPSKAETCIMSVYSSHDKDQNGTKTASGIPLNNSALTAAHKHIPLGKKVKVTNLKNGQTAVFTITDRGPYISGRCIDGTQGAARALGFSGLTRVNVEVIQ